MSALNTIFITNLSTYTTRHHNGKRFINDPGEPMASKSNVNWFSIFKFAFQKDYVDPMPTRNMTYDFNTKTNATRAWWINHATMLFQLDDKYIITDPIFDDHAAPFPWMIKRTSPTPITIEQLPKIDYILISHDHWDHLNYYSIKTLMGLNPNCTIIAPLGEGQLIRKWGYKVIIMDWRQQVKLGDIIITCFPARHMANRYGPLTMGRDLWASFLIEFKNATIYFTGDTAIGPHFKEVRDYVGRPIDLCPMPIGPQEPNSLMRLVHLDPKQAADMSKILQTRVSFPIHWGTFPLGTKPEIPDIIVLSQYWNEKQSGKLIVIKNGGYLEYVNGEFKLVDETSLIEQSYFEQQFVEYVQPKLPEEL